MKTNNIEEQLETIKMLKQTLKNKEMEKAALQSLLVRFSKFSFIYVSTLSVSSCCCLKLYINLNIININKQL